MSRSTRPRPAGATASSPPTPGIRRRISPPPAATCAASRAPRHVTNDHLSANALRHGLPRPPAPAHLDAMAPDVTIVAALAAGMLSFLSPCVLPLVPPY